MIFSSPDIKMDAEEFRQLRDFIYQHCGIFFDEESKFLLERRLGKRLQFHRLKNFKDYYYLLRYNKVKDQELNEVINIVTTNETYFFREEFQLKTFTDEILPEIKVRKEANGEEKKLRLQRSGESEPGREEERGVTQRRHEGLALVKDAVEEIPGDEAGDDGIGDEVARRDRVEAVPVCEAPRNPGPEQDAGGNEDTERLNRQRVAQDGQ